MPLLTPVWQEVERLLQANVSVIPVRDKDEGGYVKKSPYRQWKKYQREIVTKEELFAQMEHHNTTAVAIICGAVSGNLEVVDIDVKQLPGIEAQLFKDLNTLYPGLLNRLRIHQSPSGGFHLIYRVEPTFKIPGNQKLASRPSTEKELAANPAKIKTFLETRGEGGYVLAPPSMGYVVHQENPIPLITAEERDNIINLCRCYNQAVKKDATTTEQREDNYYDVNPFEHYNLSPAAEEVLLQHGWKSAGRSGDYLHFTRPGKERGISASFILSKRVYHVFTTNTELDSDRAYKPATVLSVLRFKDDKKHTLHWLVQQGYGQIKPEVEQRLTKQRAIQGKPLPANASQGAQQLHQQLQKEITEHHPHGLFWQLNDDGLKIDREGLYAVAAGLGYRHWQQQVVCIKGFFVHKITNREFFDGMKKYVHEEDAELYKEICNAYEAFVQRAGEFSISRIPLLDEGLIIRDTQQTCYKFYENGYVFITAEKYTLNEYNNLAGLIWADQVQPRQFKIDKANGKYIEFIKLACGYDQHSQSVIGYLAHTFKDETTAYIIVQTEQCPDPKQGGGTGKNVFVNLLSHTTTVKSIPGAQARFDEKFLQAWNGERVFGVSDVPKKFNFEFLKELSSGTGLVKKLWQDEQTFAVGDMPKFVIGTQYSYEVSDGGLKRRIIPLEFTDFFTRAGGVDVHFNCHFPNGWTAEDWVGYDNAVAQAVQVWLQAELKLQHMPLSETGWMKQFDFTYMQLTREFIEQNWEAWKDNFVSNADFNAAYGNFIKENNVQKSYSLSSQKMNKAITAWSEKIGYKMNANIKKSINSVKVVGREFFQEVPF